LYDESGGAGFAGDGAGRAFLGAAIVAAGEVAQDEVFGDASDIVAFAGQVDADFDELSAGVIPGGRGHVRPPQAGLRRLARGSRALGAGHQWEGPAGAIPGPLSGVASRGFCTICQGYITRGNKYRGYNIPMGKDFLTWVTDETKLRGWSDSELARRIGVSSATVSRILNSVRNASWDFCAGVAHAFGLSEDEVFRRAGLLPPLPPEVAEEREIMRIVRSLSRAEREMMMRILRGLHHRTQMPAEQAQLASMGEDNLATTVAQLWPSASPASRLRVVELLRKEVNKEASPEQGEEPIEDDG